MNLMDVHFVVHKMSSLHSFYIRYDNKQFIIDHIAPDKYSYVELVLDVYDYVLKDIPSNVSCVFIVRYIIPHTN